MTDLLVYYMHIVFDIGCYTCDGSRFRFGSIFSVRRVALHVHQQQHVESALGHLLWKGGRMRRSEGGQDRVRTESGQGQDRVRTGSG